MVKITSNNWEDQLDWSCKKWQRITQIPGGEEYPTYNKKKKAKWIGHILCRKFLLKHVTDRKIEGRTEVARWWGSNRSHSAWNLLWMRLWTCYKRDYNMNEWMVMPNRIKISIPNSLQILFLQHPLICLILQFTQHLHRLIILPVG